MAFSGTDKVWMNGKLVDWKDATIHVATHVLHYGTGVFEGIRAYESKNGSAVFRLPEHMRRLYDSCRVYRMEPPWSLDELSAGRRSRPSAPTATSPATSGRWSIAATSPLGLNPRPCPVETRRSSCGSGTRCSAPRPSSNGIDVGVSSWTRLAPNTLPAMAKATGQLRQLRPDQDAGDRRRLRRRHRARRERAGQRRQRPEPVPRARQRHLHAVAHLVDSAGHHARHRDHAGARSGLRGPRAARCRASSSTWPTRRSSAARRSKSRRSARSTRSPSATAGAGRSPRRCRSASSASSRAMCRTPTAG